jgi:hypothetical protein
MKRLINADALLEKYGGIIYREDIEAMPTAYDVNKIIDKLRKEKVEVDSKNPDNKVLQRHWNNAIDVCINIVEGAVKDE